METILILLMPIVLLAVVADYIPAADATFDEWQDNFMEVLDDLVTAGKLLAADIATLIPLQATWREKFDAGGQEANPRHSDVVAKNDARKAYVKEIRKVVKNKINTNAAITNDDRAALKITEYDTTRTRVPVPTVQPAGSLRKILPHEHVLQIVNPDTPNTKAKPPGVRVTRVFRYVGSAAPANLSQYQLVGTATRHLFKAEFTPEDVGKKAFYIFQYENTRGETGPLSDPISGGIA